MPGKASMGGSVLHRLDLYSGFNRLLAAHAAAEAVPLISA